MTLLALCLVLVAAFIHATWNYLTKLAKGGVLFTWLFSVISSLLYLPLAVGTYLYVQPQFGWLEFGFCAVTAILHLAYILLLQQGYKHGDLSLVYPLARSTGPALSTLAAIILFAERPSAFTLLGGLLIIFGVFFITGGTRFHSAKNVKHSILFGVMTGIFIGAYTIWDAYAVRILLIPPLILDYMSGLGRTIFLAPIALHNWPKVIDEWHRNRYKIIAVAILSPIAYILVLTALTFTPVSYIAPAREISVLLVVLMGSLLLKEGHVKTRLFWGTIIFLGMTILALS